MDADLDVVPGGEGGPGEQVRGQEQRVVVAWMGGGASSAVLTAQARAGVWAALRRANGSHTVSSRAVPAKSPAAASAPVGRPAPSPAVHHQTATARTRRPAGSGAGGGADGGGGDTADGGGRRAGRDDAAARHRTSWSSAFGPGSALGRRH